MEKQIFAGQFEILSRAGSSGSSKSGLVWRARDIDSNLSLVIKFYRGLDGFLRETDALKNLRAKVTLCFFVYPTTLM